MKRLISGLTAIVFAIGLGASASATTLKDMNVDVSGIMQAGLNFSQVQGADDDFDIERMRLRLRAMPEENLMFFTQIELTDNYSPAASGSNVPSNAILGDGAADSRLVDLYVAFTYLDWVTLLVGQMPTPVSYELNTDEYSLETINYSSFVGLANRDRGAGLVFPVSHEVQFITWLLNGVGAITGANNDIDDRNNYGAMIGWQPDEDFNTKIWVNIGDYRDNTILPMLTAQTAGDWIDRDIEAIGTGFDWTPGNFRLMGEYAHAETTDLNMTTNAAIQNPETEIFYLHLSYKIPETNLQLVTRYDKYDPDTFTSNDDTEIVTAGLNWDFEKNARLQLMHEFRDGVDNSNIFDMLLSVRF